MNAQRGYRFGWIVIALTLAMSTTAPIEADDSGRADRVRPEYRRHEARRPASSSPKPRSLPRALRLEGAATPGEPTSGDESAVRHGKRRDVFQVAAREGARSARTRVDTVGSWRYYRAGLWDGIRTAVDDPTLGARAHEDGFRSGGLDPEAARLGRRAGRDAAESNAALEAGERVEDQFRDLSREPRFEPWDRPRPYSPRRSWAIEPELEDVFRDYPVAGVPFLGSRARESFAEWNQTPWSLYRRSSPGELHDAAWRDPGRAFRYWSEHDRRARVYRSLDDPAERDRFRETFVRAFVRTVSRELEPVLRTAYADGFTDGWDYGAFVNAEWSYRVGYVAGFDLAAAGVAEAAYHGEYGPAYQRAYAESYDVWSRSVVPGILSLGVRDAGDDGVFEPGEALALQYEIANYGGGSGIVALRLEGRHLDRSTRTEVALAGRGLYAGVLSKGGVIRADTPVRTRTSVDVRLAEERGSVGLRVGWPLEFDGGVALDSDTLAGRAVVEVRVVNRSRRAVQGVIALYGPGTTGERDRIDLGVLEAGGSRLGSFRLTGLDPLDLLAGALSLRFEVAADGRRHDVLDFRSPEIAADLGNDDLLRYLIVLAADPGASTLDVQRARGLVLRRLRADWRQSVRARGNPYKRDLRTGGATTALGELVVLWGRQRRTLANPAVFDDLGEEIEGLTSDLPGVHPFLRRSMRKLARKLG